MVALEPLPEEIAASETGELESHGKVDMHQLGRADEVLLQSLISKDQQEHPKGGKAASSRG